MSSAKDFGPENQSGSNCLLTVPMVAKACGVSQRTVNRWIQADGLPCHHLPGRGGRPIVAVSQNDLDDWLRRFRVEPQTDDDDRQVLRLEGRRFFGGAEKKEKRA